MKRITLNLINIILLFIIFFAYLNVVKSENKSNQNTILSCEELDFDRWPVGTSPSMNFVIASTDDLELQGEINPSADWIKLSPSFFEGKQNLVNVRLDLSELTPNLYKETIHIKTNHGEYIMPVRLDLVKQRAVVQVVFDNPNVLVNGQNVLLPAPSFLYHGYSYVPLRTVCEAFGASVTYNQKRLSITVIYQDRKVEYFYNQDYLIINDYQISIPERIKNIFGVTFIPVIYLRNTTMSRLPESYTRTLFNCDIQYIDDSRTTTIIY